ncbi:MAG: flagellar biosynthetic protein FliQ [Armatimonadetes bacterium]|nr:flagellar biosynthetic protein FliQ [Armatimonadota bacterium]
MNDQFAIDLLRQSLWVSLQVAGPLLGAALVVGVGVSLVAAVTQIQDMTLTFIPKLAAVALVAVIFGPWALKVLVSFTVHLFRCAIQLAPGNQ